MIAAHWPTQTVGTFWGAVPWKGDRLLSQTAPLSELELLDWRLQGVGAFFSSIAWDGQHFQSQGDSDVSQPLSYLLPVQSFFGCFAWVERPSIGVIPQLSTRATKVPELSLDDLSDLF